MVFVPQVIIAMVQLKQYAALVNSNLPKPPRTRPSVMIVCMGTTVKLESTIWLITLDSVMLDTTVQRAVPSKRTLNVRLVIIAPQVLPL
jgi:hypothetical protein